MKLEVPQIKDTQFGLDLFRVLSEGLTDLKIEHGKWPDRILFCGPFGKESLDYIKEKDWDFTQFNPSSPGGPVNKIRIEYSKPLSQVEERGGTIFDEALADRTINGIPDAKTMGKIQTAYSNLGYTIERSVRPSWEIKLTRKK